MKLKILYILKAVEAFPVPAEETPSCEDYAGLVYRRASYLLNQMEPRDPAVLRDFANRRGLEGEEAERLQKHALLLISNLAEMLVTEREQLERSISELQAEQERCRNRLDELLQAKHALIQRSRMRKDGLDLPDSREFPAPRGTRVLMALHPENNLRFRVTVESEQPRYYPNEYLYEQKWLQPNIRTMRKQLNEAQVNLTVASQKLSALTRLQGDCQRVLGWEQP